MSSYSKLNTQAVYTVHVDSLNPDISVSALWNSCWAEYRFVVLNDCSFLVNWKKNFGIKIAYVSIEPTRRHCAYLFLSTLHAQTSHQTVQTTNNIPAYFNQSLVLVEADNEPVRHQNSFESVEPDEAVFQNPSS